MIPLSRPLRPNPRRPVRGGIARCLALLLVLGPVRAVAKDAWQDATADELTGATPSLEADAPAEALLLRIDVNDLRYPAYRTVTEYARYKIFDPEKAGRILRLSQQSASINGTELRNSEMSARLTLPDGQVREFGASAIRERTVVRDAASDSVFQRVFGTEGLQVSEKFLAVGGVLPGSILEFRLRVEETYPKAATFRPIQIESVPVRRLEYRQSPPSDSNLYRNRSFVLNPGTARAEEDKRSGDFIVTASDLPSLHRELFSGAPPYYAATVASCYTSTNQLRIKGAGARRRFGNDQPWAAVATIENWRSEDHINLTPKVRQLAASLAQGAVSDWEKARRIHDYVQQLCLRFARREVKARGFLLTYRDVVPMDDVIDFERVAPPKLQSVDFLWLDVSLCRAAGLDADVLMLPDRNLSPFTRDIVADSLLPERCAAVRLADGWHFSLPDTRLPRAFDTLPWETTGQGGLLALDDPKQNFIPVPFSPPERSRIENSGTFRLDGDGTLRGECKLVFKGHDADSIRAIVGSQSPEQRVNLARSLLRRVFPGAELAVAGLENVDDPYKAVGVSYGIRWQGFAVLTDSRIIFSPLVFHARENSPFASAERHCEIYFQYHRQESDRLTMALPPGYEIEVKAAPASIPGDLLSYRVQMAFDPGNRTLQIGRDFSSSLISAPVPAYPSLKRWFDAVANSDRQSIVLVRRGTARSATPAGAP